MAGPVIPPPGDAKHRTADEAQIVELLALHGWAFELRSDAAADARRQAAQALVGFVQLGLPWAPGPDGGRRFDPAEALNHLKAASLNGALGAWRERCVPTGRRLAWEGFPSPSDVNSPPPTASPERYRVSLRREFNLAGDVGRSARLRLPLPIEDEALQGLSVRFLRPPEGEASVRTAPALLDATVVVPASGRVTVGVETEFVAHPWRPHPRPLEPAEVELFTRPNEGLLKVSACIKSLADRLAGDGVDTETLVRRAWNFMLDELACGAVRYDELDPAAPLDWALESGWYDCQLGSALIAAVCRARGAPARLLAGYLLRETAPSLHYWMEVWLPRTGWTPFDLLCWDLSGGGRDGAWRDHHFASLEPRMKTQVLPRLFNGLGAVRLPQAWRSLPRATSSGTEIAFDDLDSGDLIYREFVDVERLGPA